MAQQRASRNLDATTTLDHLRQTTKKQEWAKNAEAQGFLREAEAMIQGQAPDLRH